jgi:hypothetical protein
MLKNNSAIQGPGWLGKNCITWGKLTALACHPTKKLTKLTKLTFLNIGGW